MSVTLSSADLAAIPAAARLLASPLDHERTDDWRRAVNRCLKELLGADSIGFLLPNPDAPLAFSEEHDPAEINQYADWVPPSAPDGRPVFQVMLEMGVSRIEDNYQGELDRYLSSSYYNEFAGPNRACDTLTAACTLPGEGPLGFASIQLWHDRWDGAAFGPREVALLQMLYPAFLAGVDGFRRWSAHRDSLLGLLDSLGDAIQVCSASGAELHRTPALLEILERDPESDRLLAALGEAARSLAGCVGAPPPSGVALPGRAALQVETAAARYRARACLYEAEPRASAPLIVVSLDRLTPVPRSEAELQETYGLTAAESRVAQLLAQGRRNVEVADALVISPHTARRHTERVLRKLHVQSRAEVAPLILG